MALPIELLDWTAALIGAPRVHCAVS